MKSALRVTELSPFVNTYYSLYMTWYWKKANSARTSQIGLEVMDITVTNVIANGKDTDKGLGFVIGAVPKMCSTMCISRKCNAYT